MKTDTKINELKSYLCSLDGEHWENINSFSRGAAKSEYYREYSDFAKYTQVKCRVGGYPYTSEDFKRMAEYRQIPFAYCGMSVKVGNWNGAIVGHNSSANLNVVFIDGEYKGQTLNCHPHSQITYFDKKGNIIKKFDGN